MPQYLFTRRALRKNRDKKVGTAGRGRLLFASLYHTCMNIWVITVAVRRGGAKAEEDRQTDVLFLQAPLSNISAFIHYLIIL